jgi:hypothetical protein
MSTWSVMRANLVYRMFTRIPVDLHELSSATATIYTRFIAVTRKGGRRKEKKWQPRQVKNATA